jgi:hypothetical protein
MINLKYIALLSDTLLGGAKKIKPKKKPSKKTMKKKHRKIKYDSSSSSESSSSSSDSTIYRTKKDKEKEIIFVPVETQYYMQNNNLTPVKLNPTDSITFLGMLDNNTPYQCNPEYYVNKESFFTSDEILCFEIIIAYYMDNYNQRKVIDVPFIGLSAKFPGYMFYVKSYMWDYTTNKGVFSVIVYKIPNIPRDLFITACRTPMWLQYYQYYIVNLSRYFNPREYTLISNFNSMYNMNQLILDSERNMYGRIMINYR